MGLYLRQGRQHPDEKRICLHTRTVGTALSLKTFTYGDGSWKDLLTQIQVENNNPNTVYLLSSVRHELRHSYQHYAIENSKTKVCGKQNQYVVGRKTLLEWEYCLKHYIVPDEKIDDYQKQVIEYDARWFSGQLY